MDLSSLSISYASVLTMGLIVVTAYAVIWSVRKVISLAADDLPQSTKADAARDSYFVRESLYREGFTDREYRQGRKGTRYDDPAF